MSCVLSGYIDERFKYKLETINSKYLHSIKKEIVFLSDSDWANKLIVGSKFI